MVFLIFYAPLKEHIRSERKLTQAKVRATLLNHDLPDFKVLAAFMDAPSTDARFLQDFIEYYQKILKLFPQTKEIHHLLGYCRFYLGSEKDAVKSLEEALRQDPGSFWSHYDLGMISLRNGDDHTALEHFYQATRLSPESVMTMIAASKLYQQVHSSKENPEPVGLSLKSGYRESYRLMGLIHFKRGDFDKMLSSAVSAIKMQIDEKGEFFFLAGVASHELKDHKNANSFLQECLKKDPGSAEAYQYLARNFYALGEKELGEKAEKAAKEMNDGRSSLQVDKDSLQLKIF